ncbi:MAG TPA: aminodeoxychorismate synthase component I, partial [Sphingobacteriaceae bacterium]
MQEFRTEHPEQYKKRALQWASLFDTACYFDSNSYPDPYSAFDVLIAAGAKTEVRAPAGRAFRGLEEFLAHSQGYRLGFFGYDLKNETEKLVSGNPDNLNFPDLYFFEPVHLIIIKGTSVRISSPDAAAVHRHMLDGPEPVYRESRAELRARISPEEYIGTVEKIRDHIRKGDVYEVT